MDRETVKTMIRDLVEKKVFGPSIRFNEEGESDTHFASTIVPMEILVESNGKEVNHKAILKLALSSQVAQELFMTDDSFKNELIIYKNLLPLINAEDIFPKMIYGQYTKEDYSKDMIILDDLNPQGFRLSDEKIFLDFDHLSLLLKKLGNFHGLSHIAKSKNEFLNFHRELSKSKFEKENHPIQIIAAATMQRAIKPVFIKTENKILKELLERSKNVKNMMKKLFETEEPFSVLCHGDFNRNNIFFKYELGRPVDVKFFDLQTARYTTPALDLAFILYMNTTKEMRKNWDDFIKIYWEGLTSVCIPKFTFQQFLDHFATRAIYGFIPSSFFLPVMMADERINDDFTKMTLEEKLDFHMSSGGDVATNAISEIVEHLLEKNYIEPFLRLWK